MNKRGNKAGLFLVFLSLIFLFALVFFVDKTFVGNVVDETCNYSLTNSTPTDWVNQTSCFTNGTLLQNRSFIEYDLSNCSIFVNVTHFESQEINCTFVCVANFLNTSWSDWEISGDCINNVQLKNRSRIQYDLNSCNESLDNETFWDYSNVSCISCTSSFVNISSDWIYNSSCENGFKIQLRNITQYDSSNCTLINSTFYESQNTSCVIPVTEPAPIVPEALPEKTGTSNLSSTVSSNTSNSGEGIFVGAIIFLLFLGLVAGGIIAWVLFFKKEEVTQSVSYNSATPYTPS